MLRDVLTGPLSNTNNSVIVTDGFLNSIYQVDITTGTTSQLLPFGTASGAFALAYDSTNKLLYFTDYDTIKCYSLSTYSTTVIYKEPLGKGRYTYRLKLL